LKSVQGCAKKGFNFVALQKNQLTFRVLVSQYGRKGAGNIICRADDVIANSRYCISITVDLFSAFTFLHSAMYQILFLNPVVIFFSSPYLSQPSSSSSLVVILHCKICEWAALLL